MSNDNPDFGKYSFDNVITSMLMVLLITFYNGWIEMMDYIGNSVSYVTIIYFVLVILICADFLTNLTIAVFKGKYLYISKELDTKLK